MGDFQSLKEIYEARQKEKQEEPKQVVETPKTKREKLFFKLKERVNELDKETIKNLFIEKVSQDNVIRKRTKAEDKEVDLYVFKIYEENSFEIQIDLIEPDALTFLADIFIFDLNNVFVRKVR
jgi:hypothetical protein